MIYNKLGKPNFARLFSITLMLTFLSCSSSGKNTRATNRHGKGSCGMIEITYDFAEVGLRTSGETWDTESKAENGLDKLIVGGLLMLLSVPAGLAFDAAGLFTQPSSSDGSRTEPDLVVAIIGEKQGYSSPIKMNQSNAYWNYTAVIDTDLLEKKLKLLVSDADPEGADTVGIQYIDKKQLCTPGMHEFKNFGQGKISF